jgi:hypothetical protein
VPHSLGSLQNIEPYSIKNEKTKTNKFYRCYLVNKKLQNTF